MWHISIPIVHDDVQALKALLGRHARHRLRLVSDTKRFLEFDVGFRMLHCFVGSVGQLLKTSRKRGLNLIPSETHQIRVVLIVGDVLQLIRTREQTL